MFFPSENKIIRKIRQLSIEKRMRVACYIICIAPIVAVAVVVALIGLSGEKEKAREYMYNYAYQAQLKMDNMFEQYADKMTALTENNDLLTDIYICENSSDYHNQDVHKRVEDTMESVLGTQEGVDFAVVYGLNSKRYYYGTPVSGAGMYEKVMAECSRSYEVHDILYEYEGKKYLLSAQRKQLRYDKVGYVYVVIGIDLEYINRQCLKMTGDPRQTILITDYLHRIIVCPDPDLLFKDASKVSKWNTPRMLRYEGKVSGTNWNITSLFPNRNLWLQWHYILILLFCVFLCTFMYFVVKLITKSIVSPLEILLRKMKNAETYDFRDIEQLKQTPESSTAKDEHALLSRNFDSMVTRLQQVVDAEYKAEIEEKELRSKIKELELNALQQQINPHFLYNIMENIFWKAEEKGCERISEMISALGDFFKTSVSENEEYVNISTEIENAKSYIFLQQMMYQDRFTVEWNIDSEVKNCKTVKLMLQPMIENAIVHGLSEKETGGKILLSFRKMNGEIHICIADNGTGMSRERVAQVQQYVDEEDTQIIRSVGIKNVNQRIKLFFGNGYGMRIESELEKGTCVWIKIPVKE